MSSKKGNSRSNNDLRECNVDALQTGSMISVQTSIGLDQACFETIDTLRNLNIDGDSQVETNIIIEDPPMSPELQVEGSDNIQQSPSGKTITIDVPANLRMDDERVRKKLAKKLAKLQIPARKEAKPKQPLLSHLVQHENGVDLTKTLGFSSPIHRSIMKLGLLLSYGFIPGSTEKCCAFIKTLEKYIKEMKVSSKDIIMARDFVMKLSPSLTFLNQCRTLEVGMGNMVRYLKMELGMYSEQSPEKMKEKVIKVLKDFETNKILNPRTVIAQDMRSKIVTGDVIVTYSHSEMLMEAMQTARSDGIEFKVIVVDSKPHYDGRRTVAALEKMNLEITYTLFNGLVDLMGSVTKAVIEADAILANGRVLAPIGSSVLFSVARFSRIPTIVLCETYKFTDRSHTDTFVFNLLGDPDDLFDSDEEEAADVDLPSLVKDKVDSIESCHGYTCEHKLSKNSWKQRYNTFLLNLEKDIIPASLVSAIITEVGMIPALSSPAVFRIRNL